MKPETRTPDLEPGMAELYINLPGQAKPFKITGYEDELAPYAAELQAYDTAHPVEVVHSASKAPKTAQTAPERPTDAIAATGIGRIAIDIKTSLYDRAFKTNFKELVARERADRRNLKFAVSLGLISVEETTCAKHRAAVSKLHNL